MVSSRYCQEWQSPLACQPTDRFVGGTSVQQGLTGSEIRDLL